jgi:hypothetical protein
MFCSWQAANFWFNTGVREQVTGHDLGMPDLGIVNRKKPELKPTIFM